MTNEENEMHNKYLVHEVRGGLMEDPDFHYHNEEVIIADSKEEARRFCRSYRLVENKDCL